MPLKKRKSDDLSDNNHEIRCYKQRRDEVEVETCQHFYERVTHQILYAFYHRVGMHVVQTVRFTNGNTGQVSVRIQIRNEAQALLTLEANDEILEQLVIPWWGYSMVCDVLTIALSSSSKS